jgi:hypothetical protein
MFHENRPDYQTGRDPLTGPAFCWLADTWVMTWS